jgi:hypothetical protein
MIICSKPEANGATREFLIDDTQLGAEVPVRTHLSGLDGAEQEWSEAGVIVRDGTGVIASVVRQAADRGIFVKLEKHFTNEIAALQAIAVSYQPN